MPKPQDTGLRDKDGQQINYGDHIELIYAGTPRTGRVVPKPHVQLDGDEGAVPLEGRDVRGIMKRPERNGR